MFLREDAVIDNWFGIHEGLLAGTRVPPIATERARISTAELLLLFLCGAAAASATGFIRLGLRVPGHAIVLAVIPMALGLSLAPRRLAGFVMSAGAFGTASAMSLAGVGHYGTGAVISLCLAGPVMDFALARVRSGRGIYLGLVLAGMAANLLALASRGASKLLGLDVAGAMRPFDSWWSQALVTYTLSGVVAGLIAAVCCFHLRRRKSPARPETAAGKGSAAHPEMPS